jgi:membrane protein implicated in regulation of membrane protease activity
MDPWIWWVIAAGVLVVAEILTTSLVFAMIAGGAAAAAVVALIAPGVPALQFGAFAIVSVALLAVVRPVAVRHLHTPSSIRTGVAALVGAEAEVLEPVSGRDGRIKLSGEIWSAKAYDGQSEYGTGETVRVVEISGATALVA